MNWIALRMLTGNLGKYLGIIAGVAFAALLIAQQSSIFCGLMLLTSNQIGDIQGADIWVMDPNVRFVDDIKPLSDTQLYRVRGVEGVQWAVRLYKGLSRARLRDGNFQQVILLGLDDATLVGAPPHMVLGEISALRQPDAIIIDEAGYNLLWPGEPLRVGRVLEMNDRRAIIVGICKASKTFQTFPIIYTLYSQAVTFAPPERKVLSFVLAQPQDGLNAEALCQRIEEKTGLKALTNEQFRWATMWYYLENTGIPINFGVTVVLGFIVGAAISGQTFYLFTVENLAQYAMLKAMGTTNLRMVGMILLQALLVGAIGYGIGIGMAATFGAFAQGNTKLAFYMPWQVLVGTGIAVVLMVVGASLLSIRRVLVLEPAVVFRSG
jgi:putative ABC transport system permease protein